VVAVAVNGTGVAKPRSSGAVSVVPANTSAVAERTTRATRLGPPWGSTTIVEFSAPPKPTRP
jgi:hypothetical protein